MPAPIQLEGPYYPPLKQRLLRTAARVALGAVFAALIVSATALTALLIL